MSYEEGFLGLGGCSLLWRDHCIWLKGVNQWTILLIREKIVGENFRKF
jgi:hypothetical protein